MGPLVIAALTFALAAAATLLPAPTAAQDYPTKPVRLITGSMGTGSDLISRMLAQRLTERWGKQVVVDNRTGVISAQSVAGAPPDGYTLLMGQLSTHATITSIYKNPPYDPVKDFAPVTLAGTGPLLLVVHPLLPASDLREFIEYVKQRPRAINVAATTSNSNGRLTMVLFSAAAGVEMIYVPYKTTAATITAILGREAHVSFPTVLAALPHVSTGRLKAYAVTSRKRFSGAPAIPTVDEAGLPGFESTSWWGMFAPARTSPALVARLNRDMVGILRMPDTQKMMLAQGIEPAPSTPQEFAAFITSEIAKWGNVIRSAGIEAE